MYVCAKCMYGYVCHGMHVEVKEQLCGVSSFHLYVGQTHIHGSNSHCQECGRKHPHLLSHFSGPVTFKNNLHLCEFTHVKPTPIEDVVTLPNQKHTGRNFSSPQTTAYFIIPITYYNMFVFKSCDFHGAQYFRSPLLELPCHVLFS